MQDRETAIREVVYNDENIVNVVRESPQTYNSILKEYKDNGTMQVVLRRRLSRLVKNNSVWKLRVPGTRFGLVIYCTPEHDYKIIVVESLVGVKVYYLYDFKDYDSYIVVDNYWELVGKGWSQWKYSDTPLTVKKYRCLKIWE